MAPSPLRERLIAEAVRYLGTREEPKGSNRGTRIDYWLQTTGAPLGQPWCAAFVWAMGLQATGRTLWPIAMSARVQSVYEHAEGFRNTFKDPAQAKPGDLVVFWYPSLKRYGHIAILEHAVEGGRVRTIDGNTAPDAAAGSAADREGYGVFRKNRPMNDRVAFIRWTP